MASFRATYTINRPALDVYTMIVDVGNYPTWHPRISTATKITAGPFRLGTRFHGTTRPFGWLDMEVTEYEEPKHVKFRVDTNVAMWDHLLLLTPQDNRTRVDHVFEIKSKGLGILMTPLMGFVMRRTLNKAMAALEQRLEASGKG